MKIRLGGAAGIILLTVAGLVGFGTALPGNVAAQQRGAAVRQKSVAAPRSMAYATSREAVIQGTVVKFEEASKDAPIGAHAKVQTASGIVDVHLGPNSYLKRNHFSLAAGDAVRIAGSPATNLKGQVFLARTIQRGSDTITVRTARGFVAGSGETRAQVAKNGTQSLQRGVAR
jgi:hypothetical protein